MDDLVISEWTDDDIPQLLELSRTTLGTAGAVAKTGDFWRWKHRDNPFGRSYGIYAEDVTNQRAAALRILLRWRFESQGGMQLRAARAVDTATHPDYQRRGLFTRLTQQALADLRTDGTRLIFNTPNDKSLPGYVKMGWTLVDRRSIYLRFLRPVRMVGRRLRPVDRTQLERSEKFFKPGQFMPWQAFVREFDTDVWALVSEWEKRRLRCGWRTPRSKAYYEWRYGQHPHVTYYVHALTHLGSNGGELAGFAVVRPNVRFGWQEAVLCEMVVADASNATASSLVHSLIRNLRADYIAAHFASDTVEYRSIRKNGFLPAAGRGMQFAVRPLDEQLDSVTQSSNWDLSLGDLEVF